ncbi:MAG: hypothetical protein KF862_15500 [Chitinophagaceae bacterium]|nr:hypothetical protein [Chitinophagaceae bacterium]
MKQILSIIMLLMSCMLAKAQYNNEWIDYNKTYYRFKVAKDGVYRIPQKALQPIGLGNTPAEQFQLWRNGIQVPLFTPVAAGPMDTTGYIEFWGEMNDGRPDKGLYHNINFQLSDKWSLETDSASYFLTVNPAGNNLRFVTAVNNVAGNVLPEEPYFMYTAGKYFRDKLNSGYANIVGEYVYSSVYDKGEGYTSNDIYGGSTLTDNMLNMYPYSGGPNASFYIAGAGNAANNRTLRVSVSNTQVLDVVMDVFNDQKQQVAIPASLLASGTAKVDITNTSANSNDRMVIAKYEITYARQFNFGGASNFVFELAASNNGNFLKISNFNYGGTDTLPVLYDLTNFRRYEGNISEAGFVKFALQPSAQKRKLALVNERSLNIHPITSFSARNFINYSLTGNQGDYLIISNQWLFTGANGNPVEAYRQYRSSGTGGGYNAKIYDVDQLTDQFAFGIKRHPAAVKNFIKYATDLFQSRPRAIFLIGKGVSYPQAKQNEDNALLDRLNLVPPFGYPASDNLLAARDNQTISDIPIGRLSAVTPAEVEIYLNKVKEYEAVGVNAPQTVAGRGWMKNIVHAIGGGDAELSAQIGGYMNQMKNIIEDTLFGGNVKSFSKTSAVASQLTNEELQQMFATGIGILNYFGHSSSSIIDFNIEEPTVYSNQGKYPMFLVNGCLAGDIFNFDVNRFTAINTLSEKYVLANQRGSIGFIASSHFGIVNYLNTYLQGVYKALSIKEYGKPIGSVLEESFRYLLQNWAGDYYARLHAEEITLHGDPAVKLYMQALPDYIIEDQYVKLPPVVSSADSSFQLEFDFFNVGMASPDSINVEIKRQFPQGNTSVISVQRLPGTKYKDKLVLSIPINPALEKGENKIIITLDAGNEREEVSEMNNIISKSFFIIEDEASPIYPYRYSIVNKNDITFYASTANPIAVQKSYTMEIDTTALFNSPAKKTTTTNSKGGLIEFNPSIVFSDSIVYYWRVSPVPQNNEDYYWSVSSFVYINGSTEGFNQSHYFQHLGSEGDGISLDDSRLWKFGTIINSLFIRNAVYPTASGMESSYINSINNEDILGAGCNYDELIFQVIDPVTFKPWKNDFSGSTGLYNSLIADCGSRKEYNFQYLLSNSTSRKQAMDFMDIIPDGYYVIVRTNANPTTNSYIDAWKADTTLYGSGNSLYHKFINQGFSQVDSFYRPRAWSFVYKKNDADIFTPRQQVSQNEYDVITMSVDCPSPDSVGYIISPKLGPSKEWYQFHWGGSSLESPSKDHPSVDIVGIRADNSSSVLFSLTADTKDIDISSVSASEYPYIQLKMQNIDTARATPYQLKFWRLNYKPFPEGAVAPAIYFEAKDTVDVGEPVKFGVAFKNISQESFDSLKFKVVLIDKNNVQHEIIANRVKPLVSGDTIRMEYVIDTKNYPGLNTVMISFNPDNDQPEEYLLNNFLYKALYVRPDTFDPLLDVTFDGVHILNNDIVSAKPHILISLKDDSRFMLIDDTALIKVQVKYPDGTLRNFSFNNDTLRFTPPAVNAGSADNTATIDFNPAFLEDGDYELIVSGRDKSGNASGQAGYKVSFKVINKPMISNLFNYPNPFTTSTAFVFTLTGNEIPQNLRIQILTITGKIVREITKEELGAIHIGRNITEYKWDGTDQYGQRLANGVYLYRVITNLNGKSLDKYKAEGDTTDQYFNKGYGKMYLMR